MVGAISEAPLSTIRSSIVITVTVSVTVSAIWVTWYDRCTYHASAIVCLHNAGLWAVPALIRLWRWHSTVKLICIYLGDRIKGKNTQWLTCTRKLTGGQLSLLKRKTKQTSRVLVTAQTYTRWLSIVVIIWGVGRKILTAPYGLWGCKNRSTPFRGRVS